MDKYDIIIIQVDFFLGRELFDPFSLCATLAVNEKN